MRVKSSLVFGAIAAVCTGGIIVSTDAIAQTASDQPGAATSAPLLGNPDQVFLMTAVQDAGALIGASQIVAEKASTPELKQSALQRAADYAALNVKLTALSKTTGLPMPTNFDSEHMQEMTTLRGTASGISFDRRYLAMEDGELQELVMAYQREADIGKNPQLKTFAAQTLPALQQHAAEVKALAAKLPQAATP